MIQPEVFTQLSLERDGTERLKERLQSALQIRGLAENEELQKCISDALELHKDDRRTYEPYNNHLLRVTLILLEGFDITDVDILKAAIMHDVLEDHPLDLARRNPLPEHRDEIEAIEASPETTLSPPVRRQKRKLGARTLEVVANPVVAGYVGDVSNPIIDDQRQKNESYREHMQDLIANAPVESVVIKLADFLDNAFVPLGGQEDPEKRRKLDLKQLPIYDLFIQGMPRLRELLSEEVIREVTILLETGRELARVRLAEATWA